MMGRPICCSPLAISEITRASWFPFSGLNNDEHNFFLGGENDKCRFFSARDGLFESPEVGACQAEYNFFETHDAGMTWNPAPVVQAGGVPGNRLPGTFYLGDCDGSAISYYPPTKTVVIAEGDEMDERAKGVVRLELTKDAGQTWRHIELPLPEKYRDGLVASSPPYFFDRENALLPVYVSKWNANNSRHIYRILMFYATNDGGNSWMRKPAVLDRREPCSDWFQFQSPAKVMIQRDSNLDVTRDGAQSWLTLTPGLGEGARIAQIDFVDARRGWLVVDMAADPMLPGQDLLYRTENGGVTWKKQAWKILR